MTDERLESSLLDRLKASPGLPAGFIFSQGSLQDYTECPRRFLLRYLLRLTWPALQSEPVTENEYLVQQGERFHRLVQQYFLGVPANRLEAMIHDDELRLWWEQFIHYAESLRDARRLFPESGLSTPLGVHRLVAQFDLVAADPNGKFTIFDWKTSRRKPRRAWLGERMQTRVYPYLLARAGAGFNGGQPISPENVEMIYWFPGYPGQPERFAYSSRQYAEDQAYLTSLVQEIARRAGAVTGAEGTGGDPFPQTERVGRCAFCVFRSLCERGERAGSVDETDENFLDEKEPGISLDFEQISEIEF
jgi:PD-(D/E)XK nuclease superfamily